MTHILVSHLGKSFGSTQAVQDINLQVEAGEIYGLIGPDGAGKTTTMRLLCGALLPDPPKGNTETIIQIAGQDMLKKTDLARAQLGYLPQRFSMYEELTVLENLRFFAETRGLSEAYWKPRCLQILEFVGLASFVNRQAGQLSGGMRQKLGLAVALVHSPKVLLLDEPTTGVDPVTRQDFWQLIIRLLAEEGIAVLVSTPYMDEAGRCGRVGFMRKGRILLEGQPDELRKRLNGRIMELHGEPLPLLRDLARKDPNVEDAQMFGDRLHLRIVGGSASAVTRYLKSSIPAQGGKLSLLRTINPQLEDVFIDLLEKQQDDGG
ncbi:MAG TPA: ABC transporter ATP-binding protein [Anaerolineales bacterium]|nr:ABC transporter ATP-binding protein [Anaerolineales bacterium]